ncbi:MAG: hypothetical protein NZ605_09850, partial [Acidimicrobiales bacterium]|nr:hypothetical protein [Acidimicrobiales bacterium]
EEFVLQKLRDELNVEPAAGEWYVLTNLAFEGMPTISLKRWEPNYAVGPFSELKPVKAWKHHRTEVQGPSGARFEVYRTTGAAFGDGDDESQMEKENEQVEEQAEEGELSESEEETLSEPDTSDAETEADETPIGLQSWKERVYKPYIENLKKQQLEEQQNRESNQDQKSELAGKSETGTVVPEDWRDLPQESPWRSITEELDSLGKEFKRADRAALFECLDDTEIANKSDYDSCAVYGALDVVGLPRFRASRAALVVRNGDKYQMWGPALPSWLNAVGRRVLPIDFLEKANRAERAARDLVAVAVFSRPLVSRLGRTGYEQDGTTAEQWRKAQALCKETRRMLALTESDSDDARRRLLAPMGRGAARRWFSTWKSGNFRVENGVLHRDHLRVVPRVKTSEALVQQVETKHLRTWIIQRDHEGHHDLALTRRNLMDRGLWWPTIDEDINVFVDRCLLCACDKAPEAVPEQNVSEVYENKGDAFFLDLQGPFGKEGIHLFTLCDDASAWGWVAQLKNKDVKTVWTALERVLLDLKNDEVPRIIRADNGFGGLQEKLKAYSQDHELDWEIRLVEGTTENPAGQHAIERPHRYLRRWVVSEAMKPGSEQIAELNLDAKLQRQWRYRPIYDKWRPVDMWQGKASQTYQTLAERRDEQARNAAAAREGYTAERRERAAARYHVGLEAKGAGECWTRKKFREGDLVLVLHNRAGRKSKRFYSGHWRRQVFQVTNDPTGQGVGNRLFLESARADLPIRFKLPVNSRKCKKVDDRMGRHLVFPTVLNGRTGC